METADWIIVVAIIGVPLIIAAIFWYRRRKEDSAVAKAIGKFFDRLTDLLP